MNTQQTKKQGLLSKIAVPFAVLLIGIVAAGCGGGGSAGSPVSVAPSVSNQADSTTGAVTAAKWTANDITYDINLQSSSYDAAADTTTFVYSVVSNPRGGPAISHWLLLIPAECTNDINIVSSSDETAGFGRDGSTDYTGLKFDTGYDDLETREVSLVLQGRWGADNIQILVKSGNGFVLGTAQGPSCNIVSEDHVISGSVFLDVLVNNVHDADEPAVQGIRVMLLDADGNVVAETLTDAAGAYSFTVPAGEYSVSFEIPSGLNASGPVILPVDVTDSDSADNHLGVSMNFSYIGTLSANGFTIGYWKNNLKKAIDGSTKGIQVNAATLRAYVAEISVFGLFPLNVATLDEAYAILNANGSDAGVLLSKQLMGSEFNFANHAFIGGDEMLTRLFLLHGEYLLAHAELFSRDKLLEAQKWYDAYNNSHGSLIVP